jgi:hypothetical protein
MKRLLAIALLAGCPPPPPQQPQGVRAEYTPAGHVEDGAPAPPTPAGDDEGSRQRSASLSPGAGPKPAAPTSVDYRVLPALDAAPIEKRFATAYERARRPRIAVFFNRTLSDEVREWTEPLRTTSTVTSDTKVIGPGGAMSDKTTVTTTNNPGTNPVTEQRDALGERLAWQVEAAFSQPLLAKGVKLIDRATILRLVALRSGKQGDPSAVMAVKEIEMSALVGQADYYVELLVSQATDSPLGYDLKAAVKQVSTGRIVANLTTATWTFTPPPAQPPPTRKAVATDKGYQYVDVPPPPVHAIEPTTTEVVTRMADMAMAQLADAFEHE